jgi:hypothetical protein
VEFAAAARDIVLIYKAVNDIEAHVVAGAFIFFTGVAQSDYNIHIDLLPGFTAQVLPRSDLTAVFQLYQIGRRLQVRHGKGLLPLANAEVKSLFPL